MSDKMTHILDQLSLYLDRALPAKEMMRVELHLKQCNPCEQSYQKLVKLRMTLKDSKMLTPPESFYQGVFTRIESKQAAKPVSGWGFPIKALASACLVMIAVWVTRETASRKNIEHMDSIIRTEKIEDENSQLKRRAYVVPAQKSAESVSGSAGAPLPQDSLKRKDLAYEVENVADTPTSGVLHKREETSREARGQYNVALQESDDHFTAKSARLKLSSDSRSIAKGFGLQAPAASASLSEKKLETQTWQGDRSGITSFRTAVVRSAKEWEDLWREHTSYSGEPAPPIDFTQSMVVGVFSGNRGLRGRVVEIMDIHSTPQECVVIYSETPPAPGESLSSFRMQPYHMKVIPLRGVPVRFEKH